MFLVLLGRVKGTLDSEMEDWAQIYSLPVTSQVPLGSTLNTHPSPSLGVCDSPFQT